jgi:hypothetical protein
MNALTSQPSKEKVRDYMQHRLTTHQPLPTIKEIRRQLGWDVLGTVNKSKN